MYIINKNICLLFVLFSFCSSCSENKQQEKILFSITRFDKDLYHFLHETMSQEELLEKHRSFLNLFGENIINIGSSDSLDFFLRLENYFSHPALKQLYEDEINTFADISSIEKDISFGLQFFNDNFDPINIPAVYLHTSGLSQNIVISEDFLSISADKYLGIEYALYRDFFYDYQREDMTPNQMAPDCLLGFLMSVFPAPSDNNTCLLDRMIYEGKLRYLLTLALPSYSIETIMKYTEVQENWFKTYEADVWELLIQEKHLYSQDRMTIDKYIQEAPYTAFFSNESPDKLGIRIGFQIIKSFMKEKSQTSLQELMQNTNSQMILNISKYKP